MSAQFDAFLVEFQDTIQSYMVRLSFFALLVLASGNWVLTCEVKSVSSVRSLTLPTPFRC